MRASFILSIMAIALSASVAANADSIPYGDVGSLASGHHFEAVESGDLVGYFLGSSALYNNEIGVFVNGTQLGGYVLGDHSSTVG